MYALAWPRLGSPSGITLNAPVLRRLYPYQIRDKFYLSWLLEQYLAVLQESAMQVRIKTLSWDAHIPETVFYRLSRLHRDRSDAPNIQVEDFHIVFSNLLFRFPTVKIWRQDDGEVFFEV